MAVITLPDAIKDAAGRISFRLVRAQSVTRTFGGVTQVTSYPERLWYAQIDIVPQFEGRLRDWMLANIRLSDLANKFALGPPHYSGPSTGYSGPGPVVDGANQVGKTLDVSGLTPETDILRAGDFLSFDVTSSGGSTNRQLIPVAADVTSDSSGDAEISLELPIRQSPAGNAPVNIFTPTAFFAFEDPEAGLDYGAEHYSQFTLNVIERIDP